MRPYNFGAGPATLPLPILEQAQSELLDWEHLGMSVLEIGHRTSRFKQLISDTTQQLRVLLSIPDDYAVLLLGFPARFQFGMIAQNFLRQSADYLVSGVWSKLAFEEANRLYSARQVEEGSHLDEKTDYVYYTPNETISGYAISTPPKVGQNRLIADMTSCLLSEPIDINAFDLIFAGAQKNISIPGLTVVIAKRDFLESAKVDVPTMCDYRTHLKNESNYATPPNFAIYLMKLMCDWLAAQGGLTVMSQLNQAKAKALYDYIDESDMYNAYISPQNRSVMNVTFSLKDASLNSAFLLEAEKHGLLGLKGHRALGGIRASLYNAMPIEGVNALIDFMREFSAR